MDIFSHGLWSGAVYKGINKKVKKPLNVWLAVFWGVFPDLFSFTSLFAWMFWNLTFGGLNPSDMPSPGTEPMPQDTRFIFRLTSNLYNISHSLIVFAVIFVIVFFIVKRPMWEFGAWLFHILIDIPTHSYQFYPTPFLWPVSSWKFNGFAWDTSWFLIVNYTAIIIAYYFLFRKKKKQQQ